MQIENNFFDKMSEKQNEQLNFFTDSQINEKAEPDNQDVPQNTEGNPTLEEYINDKDAYSQISTNDFNLKLENYNFLWTNKDKLEKAGFKDYNIEEAIQENDILQTTTEYWSEIDNKDISSAYLTKVEKERLENNQNKKEIESKTYVVNPINSEKSNNKEIIGAESVSYLSGNVNDNMEKLKQESDYLKKSYGSSKTLSERLDTFTQTTGINLTETEKEKLSKREQEKTENIEYTTSKYHFSKSNTSGSMSNGKAAISDFNSECSKGAAEDAKMQSKIDDKNAEITDKANKISDTRNTALRKMKKATQKSEQLTQKANKAISKVGLKSIKNKKLKSNQSFENTATNAQTNNISTESTTKESASTSNTVSNSTNIFNNTDNSSTNTNNNTDTVNKSNTNNNTTNSVQQSAGAQIQNSQAIEQKDKIGTQQKQQDAKSKSLLVNKQKVKNNEEAKEIGKQIKNQTTKSDKATQTAFKEVEESCETLETKKEYYIEETEKFETEKHKNHGKINTGIGEATGGVTCLICGVANIAIGAATTPIGIPAIIAGIALCIVGIALGTVGTCTICQGMDGHDVTYSAGTETTVKERETQEAADETVDIANNDEKQCCKIERQNTQKEKEIDKILKQSEEQDAAQKKEENEESVSVA